MKYYYAETKTDFSPNWQRISTYADGKGVEIRQSQDDAMRDIAIALQNPLNKSDKRVAVYEEGRFVGICFKWTNGMMRPKVAAAQKPKGKSAV